MKDDTVATIIIDVVLIIGIIAVIIFAVKCNNDQDKSLWNDGYCECGGHWKYEQAVGHRYSTSYIYRCDKCGNLIEIHDYEHEVTTNETDN